MTEYSEQFKKLEVSKRGWIVLEFKNPDNMLRADIEERLGVKLHIKKTELQDSQRKTSQWAFKRNRNESFDFFDENAQPFKHYSSIQNTVIDACHKAGMVGEFPLPKTTERDYTATFGKKKDNE